MIGRAAFVLLAWCLLGASIPAGAEPAAWQALREGRAVMLMRHALAPGTGDPAGFELGDCSTQRNLNDTGREQARQWGQWLQKAGFGAMTVYSSQWCRCMETARLMALGPVEPLKPLNSFFAGRGDRKAQTRQTRAAVAAMDAKPAVLVTHQVNITALTGVFPRSGEALIVSRPLTHPAQLLGRYRVEDLDRLTAR